MSTFDLRAAIQAELDEPGHVTKEELRAILAAYDASLVTTARVEVRVQTSWAFPADPQPVPTPTQAYPGLYGEGGTVDEPEPELASYPELYGATTGA